MKQPSDMTDRELDAAVAVEVMGWKPDQYGMYATGVERWPNMDCRYCTHDAEYLDMHGSAEVFAPSQDIAADYVVLVHVRETWGLREQNVFYDLLDHTWAVRTENRHRYVPENAGEYRPGDYARAALAAVRGRK